MSDFHGGFFVTRRDAGIAEPVFAAALAYLERKGTSPEGRRVAFAWRPGSPVVHVAMRGGDADGKGFALWHWENAALGGELARALGCEVWAYAYENQTGSEMTARFGAAGALEERVDASWDDTAERLGLDAGDDDPDEDEGDARLFAALPLGRLAERLAVDRWLLEHTLAYETPAVLLPLDAPFDARAFEAYLAAGDELPRRQLLFFPKGMLDDLRAAGERGAFSLGSALALAWELAKSELHALPGVDDRPPTPGPVRLPAGLDTAATLAVDRTLHALEPGGEKQGVHVDLPSRVLSEIGELARFLDRSLSWVVQSAYSQARARVWAAATHRAASA